MTNKAKIRGFISNRLTTLLCGLLLWAVGTKAQVRTTIPQLSDSAIFSLLTYDPTDEIHAMYGHTAIRVQDPEQSMDWVFNYGLFDFSEEVFLMRFVLGQTDYQLGVYPTKYFWKETQARQITTHEQRLNLSINERKRLFEKLMINLEPQNRIYRYNFLFDNCSTRPYYLIKESVDDEWRDINPMVGAVSFREAIYSCVGGSLWVKLGIEIILGGRIDRPMSYDEQFFRPLYLQERLRSVRLEPRTGIGVSRPLISKEEQITSYPSTRSATPLYLHPMLIFGLLFTVLFAVSWVELRKGRSSRWIDVPLFAIVGLFGVLIHFMIFFSEHPAVSPNWNGVIVNPLFLLMAVALLFKNGRVDRVVAYAGMVLSVASVAAVVFAPQQLPWLVLWVSVLVMVRSVVRLRLVKKATNGLPKEAQR